MALHGAASLALTAENQARYDQCTSILEASFARSHPARQLFIFGSFGSGIATENSDIDCALLGSPAITGLVDEESLLHELAEMLNQQGMHDVQVIVTRNAAPSLLKFVEPQTGISCDVTVRVGPTGKHAGCEKANLVRLFGEAVPQFRPLALLVKSWGHRRRLCNPGQRQLNTFSWIMMVIFYLANSDPAAMRAWKKALAMVQQDPGSLATGAPSEARSESLVEQELHASLIGVFGYWAEFPYNHRVDMKTCQCESQAPEERRRFHHDRGDSLTAMHITDPIQETENTARTLARRNLPEQCAELNRARVMLSKGSAWADVSALPSRKKKKELRAYVIPVNQTVHADNDAGDNIHCSSDDENLEEECFDLQQNRNPFDALIN